MVPQILYLCIKEKWPVKSVSCEHRQFCVNICYMHQLCLNQVECISEESPARYISQQADILKT